MRGSPETAGPSVLRNAILVGLGIAVLLLGLSIYLIDRPADNIPYLPKLPDLTGTNSRLFGGWGYFVPSFVHPLAFILITTGLADLNRRQGLMVCAAWLLGELLLELAQHSSVVSWLLVTPVFLSADDGLLPFIARGLRRGTFDYWDVGAVCLGSVCAAMIILACVPDSRLLTRAQRR